MLERFLKKTKFDSFEDFMQHYEVCVPEHFNFAYDVVDAWAKKDADKRAMLWVNEAGEERTFTFGEMKRWSDRTASYLQSLGIRRGDVVMLILKRRYEWWWTMLALHKLGAIVVPEVKYMSMVSVLSFSAIRTKGIALLSPSWKSSHPYGILGPIDTQCFKVWQ